MKPIHELQVLLSPVIPPKRQPNSQSYFRIQLSLLDRKKLLKADGFGRSVGVVTHSSYFAKYKDTDNAMEDDPFWIFQEAAMGTTNNGFRTADIAESFSTIY